MGIFSPKSWFGGSPERPSPQKSPEVKQLPSILAEFGLIPTSTSDQIDMVAKSMLAGLEQKNDAEKANTIYRYNLLVKLVRRDIAQTEGDKVIDHALDGSGRKLFVHDVLTVVDKGHEYDFAIDRIDIDNSGRITLINSELRNTKFSGEEAAKFEIANKYNEKGRVSWPKQNYEVLIAIQDGTNGSLDILYKKVLTDAEYRRQKIEEIAGKLQEVKKKESEMAGTNVVQETNRLIEGQENSMGSALSAQKAKINLYQQTLKFLQSIKTESDIAA